MPVHPPCGIGLDFGTSNSSVALFDGRHVVGVDFTRAEGTVVPTALYLRRVRGVPAVGQQAIDSYLIDNENRVVELSRESLGELDLFTGEGTFTFQIHALADKDMPGRLFRSLKRWLGNPGVDTLQVFETRYRLVALITPILQYLGAGVGLREEESLYLGRPVRFDGEDLVARQRLAEAARHAGLPRVSFYPEPVAAAVSFLHSRKDRPGGVYLCFDFGGGTLDLCVLKTTGDSFEILATHGVPLGGDLIDQLIYRRKVFPELGEGCPLSDRKIDGSRLIYRFTLMDYEYELLNWQLAYKLNRPNMLAPLVRYIQRGGEPARKFRRLHAVIRHNLSYAVLRAVERAKIELTSQPQTAIRLPEIELAVPISRSEFEALLTDVLDDIEQCVHAVLQCAGVPADAVTAVVCTGGSSRIPAVRACLARTLDKPVIEHEAFTGVAAGLAIAHYCGYASPLDSGVAAPATRPGARKTTHVSNLPDWEILQRGGSRPFSVGPGRGK
ncbi:MAG: Hsp70 family protein [Kiritimatiellae bacterium]|nr:Hsp70 family protein [Kiritimatiellia bacterium]